MRVIAHEFFHNFTGDERAMQSANSCYDLCTGIYILRADNDVHTLLHRQSDHLSRLVPAYLEGGIAGMTVSNIFRLHACCCKDQSVSTSACNDP